LILNSEIEGGLNEIFWVSIALQAAPAVQLQGKKFPHRRVGVQGMPAVKPYGDVPAPEGVRLSNLAFGDPTTRHCI
jgi:hypothetical protein